MDSGVEGNWLILLWSFLRLRRVWEISSVRQPNGGSVTISSCSGLNLEMKSTFIMGIPSYLGYWLTWYLPGTVQRACDCRKSGYCTCCRDRTLQVPDTLQISHPDPTENFAVCGAGGNVNEGRPCRLPC